MDSEKEELFDDRDLPKGLKEKVMQRIEDYERLSEKEKEALRLELEQRTEL